SSRSRHTRCYRDWSSTCALPIFRALGKLPGKLSRPRRFDGLLHTWQVDLQGCAPPGLAVHPDVSAALLHYAVHGSQVQSGSLAFLFGGDKGLEDVGLGFGAHSDPVVSDCQHHVTSGDQWRMASRISLI